MSKTPDDSRMQNYNKIKMTSSRNYFRKNHNDISSGTFDNDFVINSWYNNDF